MKRIRELEKKFEEALKGYRSGTFHRFFVDTTLGDRKVRGEHLDIHVPNLRPGDEPDKIDVRVFKSLIEIFYAEVAVTLVVEEEMIGEDPYFVVSFDLA